MRVLSAGLASAIYDYRSEFRSGHRLLTTVLAIFRFKGSGMSRSKSFCGFGQGLVVCPLSP